MRRIFCSLLVFVAIIGGISFMENGQSANAQGMYESSIDAKSAVRASHILVSTEEEALKLKSEIEAGNMTVADAASKYSKCPSGARNGGDLGFFGRNQMVKPFEDAAFSLPLNVVSEPVRTQFGYHLIQVTGIR